jgi:endonuclease/exonuclease/phosphatase family metal-dependent hydrolase
MPRPLSVATWNVRGCPGWRPRRDAGLLAAVIAETDADVVALQETVVYDDFDLAGSVARLLGMTAVFGPNVVRRHGRMRYGNALLSRLPVETSLNHDLSVPIARSPFGLPRLSLLARSARSSIAEPRGCLLASIGGVTFGSAHLGLLHGERLHQVRRLREILRGIDGPAVIAGDMNDWFRGRDTATMRGGLSDAWHLAGNGPRFTYPALFPVLRLDHVYVTGGVTVTSCAAHATRLARGASDHLPVVARLELTTGAGAVRRATA